MATQLPVPAAGKCRSSGRDYARVAPGHRSYDHRVSRRSLPQQIPTERFGRTILTALVQIPPVLAA